MQSLMPGIKNNLCIKKRKEQLENILKTLSLHVLFLCYIKQSVILTCAGIYYYLKWLMGQNYHFLHLTS